MPVLRTWNVCVGRGSINIAVLAGLGMRTRVTEKVPRPRGADGGIGGRLHGP